MSGAMVEWPDRLAGRLWMPDPDHSRQRHPPTGIVVHSGDAADRVAESALEDGRDVSYHFAWSRGHGCLVQLVSLQRRAWHAGAAGNGWIGIALSGPWSQRQRRDEERADFERLLLELQAAFAGTLRWWCRHSDIEPAKKDPGRGVGQRWFEAAEMRWGRPG